MDKVGNIFTLELDRGSIFCYNFVFKFGKKKEKNSQSVLYFLKSKQKMAIPPNLQVLTHARKKM